LIAEDQWREAIGVLQASSSVAVVCHISPDGDALGSMLGLGCFLQRQGKKVWMSWGSADLKTPSQYHFMPGQADVVTHDLVPADLEAFVAIDCGDIGRLELLKDKFESATARLNIDHHLSNPLFGSVNLVDPHCASSSEIAYELVKRMGGTPTADEATCFYTGIVTDTGRFQYANATPKTLRDAAELRELGVDHELVAEKIFESLSFSCLHVLGVVMSRAVLEDGVVWSWMTSSDLGELPIEETEHFIEELKVVKEAGVAALLKQQTPGEWRVSLRSRGGVDVSAVAQSFGGGGHARAAGFTGKGDLEALRKALIGRIKS